MEEHARCKPDFNVMKVVALADLFGGLESNIVLDMCNHMNDASTKREAWMGDARLKMLLSELLFGQETADPGLLTQQRARFEANDTLGWFLCEGTDLTSAFFERARSQSSHQLGTLFEALLQHAPSVARQGAVRSYMEWVEARLDPQLVVQRVELTPGTDGQLWMKTFWEWKSHAESLDNDESSVGWSMLTAQSDLSTEEGVRSALREMSLQHAARCEAFVQAELLPDAPWELGVAICELENKVLAEAGMMESGQCRTKQEILLAEKLLGTLQFNIATAKGLQDWAPPDAQKELYQLAVRLKQDGVDEKLLRRVFGYVNRYYVKQRKLPPI